MKSVSHPGSFSPNEPSTPARHCHTTGPRRIVLIRVDREERGDRPATRVVPRNDETRLRILEDRLLEPGRRRLGMTDVKDDLKIPRRLARVQLLDQSRFLLQCHGPYSEIDGGRQIISAGLAPLRDSPSDLWMS